MEYCSIVFTALCCGEKDKQKEKKEVKELANGRSNPLCISHTQIISKVIFSSMFENSEYLIQKNSDKSEGRAHNTAPQ